MTEGQIQAQIFQWASYRPDLSLLFAIPNGGTRHKIEAVNLKRQGVKSGVPDMFLPVARRGYHGLFIELKTEIGRTSKNQNAWIESLNKQGYFCEVCHGFDSAMRVIKWYMTVEVRIDTEVTD